MGLLTQFKGYIYAAIALAVIGLFANQQLALSSLQSDLATAQKEQSELSFAVTTLETNTSTLEDALNTEASEREKLRADIEQSKVLFSKYIEDTSKLKKANSEAKKIINNVASNKNETDCINSDMPDRIISLFDSDNTTAAKNNSTNQVQKFNVRSVADSNDFTPNIKRENLAAFKRINDRLYSIPQPMQFANTSY